MYGRECSFMENVLRKCRMSPLKVTQFLCITGIILHNMDLATDTLYLIFVTKKSKWIFFALLASLFAPLLLITYKSTTFLRAMGMWTPKNFLLNVLMLFTGCQAYYDLNFNFKDGTRKIIQEQA